VNLYLDTANVAEVKEACSWGVISGVTTNPSLLAKEDGDPAEIIQEIAAMVRGPVSAEVMASDTLGMVQEAESLASLHPNVVIKIPITKEGLVATKMLKNRNIPVNMTLAFSFNQAFLAALAGACYVSPFVGRLDDIGYDGMQIVRDTVSIFALHQIPCKVIAASIRHPLHVVQAAAAGAHVATVPYKILETMLHHPLTDIGIERFLADWRKCRS